MDKNLFSKIDRHYDRVRTENQKRLEERRAQVYQDLPMIKELEDGIRDKGFQGVFQGIQCGNVQGAIGDIEAMGAMKREILSQAGLGPDYLDPIYTCPFCKDTGYLEDGSRCDCLKQLLAKDLYEMSNLDRVLARENFDHFNLDVFSKTISPDEGISPYENMTSILRKVQVFLKNFPKDNGENLLFYGGTGLGKTFLSNCIAKDLLDQNYTVIYQTAFSLVDILERKKFQKDSSKDLNLAYKLLFTSDLLIIDDLGTEVTNQFTNAELFNIINTRMLGGKKLLISTNLALHEIKNVYSDRIFSRMMQSFIPIHFFGEDLRFRT